jgi:uncharacterized protein
MRHLATGETAEVASAIRAHLKVNSFSTILVFDDVSGKPLDLELSEATPLLRVAASGPGRPKLGVVSREVSLLPQHWEWLSSQSGGTSAALRRLVEDRMKVVPTPAELTKASREAAYQFLSGIGGDLPRFEDALRYLFRGDEKRFFEQILGWPEDIVEHARWLARDAFELSAS